MNKIKIAFSVLTLALFAWVVNISLASTMIDSTSVATRYINQGGICHVEVYHDQPFHLILRYAQGDVKIQSQRNWLNLTHDVSVSTRSSYKDGEKSEWRTQKRGATYQVRSSEDQILIQVVPDET